MICIGLEGTAHTIGVGIVNSNCNVLSNLHKMYVPKEGGIHPREAANYLADHVCNLIDESLKYANIDYKDIDLVAFSQGPGLGPCLRTVATAARALAYKLKKPIVGVNHCVAHLEIGIALTSATDPVLLYVSGGNTQVIAFANKRYRVFGETLDIGIGNLLDKFGREVGFKFPAGPVIEKAAKKGRNLVDLPYSVKGMDVAFSGLLTAATALYRKGVSVEDLCYSIQEITFAMLVEVTERALAHVNKDEVLLGGGVACNKRLQQMVYEMADSRGAKFYVPHPEFCIDNGAMIAWTGILMYKSGIRMKLSETAINQRFRTDSVDVKWRRS